MRAASRAKPKAPSHAVRFAQDSLIGHRAAMLIEDEILTLRRLYGADLQAFQSYRSDPVVGAYQSWTVDRDE